VTNHDSANHVTTLVEDSGGSNARTTQYYYTPDGLVAYSIAINPSTGDQYTGYFYGSTTTESGVASSTLLHGIIYPDSDDGLNPSSNGSDGIYNRVEFQYNRLGELTQRKDNNQSIHNYNYDGLGRLVDDRVTAFGTGVDQAVKRISRTYEVRGMLTGVLSYEQRHRRQR